MAVRKYYSIEYKQKAVAHFKTHGIRKFREDYPNLGECTVHKWARAGKVRATPTNENAFYFTEKAALHPAILALRCQS